MKRLSLLLVFIISTVAAAQSPQTVYVRAGNRAGTGVLCGTSEDGQLRVVLTVAHVVGAVDGKVLVGKRQAHYGGRVVGSDDASDAAMVLIKNQGPIRQIEDARLWMGELTSADQIRTEGFAYFGFYRTSSNLLRTVNGERMLRWSSPSYSGMSGGPSYLVGQSQPYVVTTTTATDGNTSMGPSRSFFQRWIPTCSSSDFDFDVSPIGAVTVQPRRPRVIEPAIGQRPVIDPDCTGPT